jgi:hypothetical protein
LNNRGAYLLDPASLSLAGKIFLPKGKKLVNKNFPHGKKILKKFFQAGKNACRNRKNSQKTSHELCRLASWLTSWLDSRHKKSRRSG